MVSTREYARLKGQAGVCTDPLPDRLKQYVNTRTGATRTVPEGVTPGFEWNQGKYGRSVPLALMLMEKATVAQGRGMDRKVIQEHLFYPVMRDGYRAFVSMALSSKQSAGKVVPVGMLDDRYLRVAEQRGKSPASGMVVMRDNLLVKKQRKHRQDDSDLTYEQWVALPDILQQPDRVYWDLKGDNQSLVFTKKTDTGILVLPVRVGGKVYSIAVEQLVSAYVYHTTYEKMDSGDRFDRIE